MKGVRRKLSHFYNSNVMVESCVNCQYYRYSAPGYVICGYWKYLAQMATFSDDNNKMEYAIGCPIKRQ